jgi:D-sedoheptulose 7-phosphate isomerase
MAGSSCRNRAKEQAMSKEITLVRRRIEESIRAKQHISKKLMRDIALAAERIAEAYRAGGRLILFGNGGSAADAQHIACELVGRFMSERKPLDAVALGANVPTLTSIANDYGYGRVLERQVTAAAKPCDIVIGISTSGDSPNVVRALARAKKIGCTTIAMTGRTGGKLKDTADILLNVPSKVTPRIQESHILIGHIICELVEKAAKEKRI